MRLDIAVVGLTFDTEAGTFSARFGVAQSQISNIRRRRTWAHVY